ncbi:hypothetical protein N7475_009463 [Penicillium sp. IBT 31633x]|nr:hypothetical protein N7475_009463 [Penicillium sp. IBT 31633x]
MGRWREQLLLSTLAALAPLSSAMETTSVFTTEFPATTVVTSSSDIAGCTVAPSMQIICSNGYYNTYGAVWQETCAASYSGGSLILSSPALSLRACASACAVRPACSAAFFIGNFCYLLQGDVTVTPGGPYQAAVRYAPSASPCVSTWLSTETYLVTSTGEVVYTVTPTPTPSATVTPSSAPVLPSSELASPVAVFGAIFDSFFGPVHAASDTVGHAFVDTADRIVDYHFFHSSSASIPSSGSSFTSFGIASSSTSSSVLASSSVSSSSDSSSTGSSLGSSSSTSSLSLSLTTSPTPSIPSASSAESASGPSASATQPTANSTAVATTTATPSKLSPSTQFPNESSESTPSTSTYTVTETQVHTITSCAASVTNCPAHQQTTYLTTETITYLTTVCPEDTRDTTPQATVSATAILHTGVIQTASPQHTITQTTTASSSQGTETGVPPSHMTTSTIYVTEIDVVTACPPSVHNCPVGERSTYTTTKTVAAYTTTYLVAITDSAQVSAQTSKQASKQDSEQASEQASGQVSGQVSQSTDASVLPVAVPTLSLAHPHVPAHGPTGETTRTKPYAPSSSAWKAEVSPSGSTQVAAHVTTMNTVSGHTASSVTTSAPSSIYTGGAPKMAHLSTLFTVAAMLYTSFFY